MHNPDDPKFAKHSEFGILKDILTKAEKYRAEKKLHGKGDTSSPNWKPKTRMGQLRYAAAAKSIEFAKDRMRTLVSDYAKDKNITLQTAYKHFDPKGELKLYNFNKNINLDDKTKETQQTLNSLKERFDKGEKVALVDVKSAISDLSAVYLIKLTNKTKEVKHSVFEERAEYLFRSAAMTKVMNENELNDLFEHALYDKGQNIWAKVNQARTELKNEKKSKEDPTNTKNKEKSKTTTTTVTNKTTVNGNTRKKMS